MKAEELIKSLQTIHHTEKISGIYAIYNIRSRKIYIGQSQNIRTRWNGHRCRLNKSQHPNPHLQSSFKKYGKSCFLWLLVESCEKDKLSEREQYWMDTINEEDLYNKQPVGQSRLRFSHSDETRKKISEANKIRFQDPEQRAKLGSLRRGAKLTDEHKTAISLANKGKKKPPRTTEHITKLSFSKSDETKKKMSDARKKYWETKRARSCPQLNLVL